MSGLGGTLVLATHNKGKVDEMLALLAPYDVSIKSAADFGLDAPIETETTFVGNARVKAHFVAKETGLPALADDSGIEVDALDGAPGVYTADWAKTAQGRDFLLAMEKTWKLVEASGSAAPHLARFRCALVLAWPDGREMVFEGTVEGSLTWPLRGRLGHGYDPMFVPEGHALTFAEMPEAMKNQISHRARALSLFCASCFT